ncbi:MAG: hypothetical protein RSF35_01050, partial [Akkermansia sp.]
MKKTLLLMLVSFAVAPLMGQDVQQIADSLTIPQIKEGAKQLPMPSVSGAQIKLLGADYEQLINGKGQISPVISDTPVNISFKVTKGGKEAISKDYEVTLKANAPQQGNPKPKVIPEILQWKGGKGDYQLSDTITVSCLQHDLAQTFADDMGDVLGLKVK